MPHPKPLPLLTDLERLISYDSATGLFRWKLRTSNRIAIGDIVGGRTAGGYMEASLNGQRHRLHRITWLMHHREDPGAQQIDHINLNRSDNRAVNLRIATHSENGCNMVKPADNTSGHKGVYWHKKGQKWTAVVQKGGKQHYLGLFADKNSAIKATEEARLELHGKFAHHG